MEILFFQTFQFVLGFYNLCWPSWHAGDSIYLFYEVLLSIFMLGILLEFDIITARGTSY